MCGGSALSVSPCGRSWQMCVKKARRGASFATVCDGALNRRMRGMRLVAERVQEQHIQARAAAPWIPAGCRCDRSDKRRCRSGSRRSDARPCSRRMGTNSRPKRSNGPCRNVCTSSWGTDDCRSSQRKDVGKAALDIAQCAGIREDRDVGALPEIERPHVVQPHQVVGVRVRV